MVESLWQGESQSTWQDPPLRLILKTASKVATFSLEERVKVTTGVGWGLGRCVARVYFVLLNNCVSDNGL